VNGELIGGCDIALQMYQSGELKTLLAAAGAAR
jgi:monothiol glutaredoxin